MKLAAWRKKKELRQAELALRLGCSQPYVSQIERAVNPIIPGADLMSRIFEVTDGEVEPNDFYELPNIGAEKDAA